jgi:hypothetical protein
MNPTADGCVIRGVRVNRGGSRGQPQRAGGRWITADARGAALAGALLLLGAPALLLLGAPALAGVPPVPGVPALHTAPRLVVAAPAATAPAVERYYVVGPPVDGQREYLYGIAVRTLGDGRRYREIFELNEGRLQPDGKRLRDPTVLEPGWILRLPSDARGPDVRVGPLPSVMPDRDAPAPATAEPTGTAGPTPALGLLSRYRAMEIFVLLGILLVVGSGGWFGLRALRSLRARRASGRRAGGRPGLPAAPVVPAVRPALPAGYTDGPGHATPGGPGDAVPAERFRPAEVAVPPPVIGVDESGGGWFPELETEVVQGAYRAVVRLIGARSSRWSVPYLWLAADATPPPGGAPVILGHGPRGRLWIDLSLVPDVLTVAGGRRAHQRYALGLIAQLQAAGAGLTLVGAALADTAPPKSERIDTLEDLTSPGPGGPVRVVVCAGSDRSTLAALRRLAAAPRTGLVPIVLGDSPRARWSIGVGRLAEGTRSAPGRRTVSGAAA